MRRSRVLKHLLLASTLALAGGAEALASPQAGVEARRIDIPSQDLARALMALSSASGRNVLFDPQLVARKRSAAVRDARSFERALDMMLVGTGLRSRVAADGSVTIEGGV